MKTIDEVLEYITENDVKFVKLSFCDINGLMKNVSINALRFGEIYEKGVVIDSSATGFPITEDLILFPDLDTITTMPWRPSTGAVINMICRIKHRDGRVFDGDCGAILKAAEKRFKETGYTVSFMTESEFYIMKLGDDGEPTLTPNDNAGYLDTAPFDKSENLRREIIFNLENMGMKPQSSHHEAGKGQNAVIFQENTPYRSAVNTVFFRNAVRNIAYANGVYATFAPCPLDDSFGSNFRIVAEFKKDGKPISVKQVRSFADGILERIPEMTAFTNPIRNSYRRLAYPFTPCDLTINQGTKSVIRIHDDCKLEIVSADTACNPFITLALLLDTFVDVIGDNIIKSKKNKEIPISLGEAIDLAKQSEFIKKSLPQTFVKSYLAQKQLELRNNGEEDVLRDGI